MSDSLVLSPFLINSSKELSGDSLLKARLTGAKMVKGPTPFNISSRSVAFTPHINVLKFLSAYTI
jgi:hypothetical protein